MKLKALKIISLLLVVAIIATSVVGVNKVTAGEEIDVDAKVAEYNSQVPDFSSLFEGISKEELSAEIDDLDVKLSAFIATVDINSLLYNDSVATLLVRGIAELCGRSLMSIDFKAMSNDFPEAYNYLEGLKATGIGWQGVETIPFGIEAGNKRTFIKACGAGAAHLGDTLLKVILYAPTAYNNALVPALESIHLGKMPSIYVFALQTGLSPSARIEYILEHILSIIDPIKKAPLTYLCSMLPDFIINYNKACDFINTNEKITSTGLKLPTIESIIDGLIKALRLNAAEIDYDYLSKMGTASSGKSGYTGGKRVHIQGDREVIFAYLADYILGLMTYGDNFDFVEKLIKEDIKSDVVKNSKAGELLNSSEFKQVIASLVDILAKLKPREEDYDAAAETGKYNAKVRNFDGIFKWPATEENVTAVLNSVEARVVNALKSSNLEEFIYSDEFATVIAKVTAHLCNRELTDITFAALKASYRDAYDYISLLQSQNKTWSDVEVIPFGITPGDKEMFIKACGAGSEHFGDALALCIILNPHAYDGALLPVLESLHTGAMPVLEDFVAGQGLDGVIRMEELTEKVLTIMEPIMEAPLSYLCEILPDFIVSYNKAAEILRENDIQPLLLPDLGALANSLLYGLGIILPDYDFSVFTDMATAEMAESGNYTGYRMQLNGDREVVFMGLATYLTKVLRHGDNMNVITRLLSDVLGMDSSILTAITSLIA